MTFLSLILSLLFVATPQADIDRLWKSYEAAILAGQPETQTQILSEIKDKAGKEGLVWEYFKACFIQHFPIRMGGETYDRCRYEFEKDIRIPGESVLWFFWRHPGLEYLLENKAQLKASAHRDLWKNDSHIKYSFNDVLFETFENDWDYACFASLKKHPELVDEFKGRYPLNALAEFIACKYDKLSEFRQKYEGNAVCLLAREAELDRMFHESGKDSKHFFNLEKLCKQLERQKKLYGHGIEKAIAESVKSPGTISKALKGKDCFCYVRDGRIRTVLQNINDFDLSIWNNGEQVWKRHVDNPSRSFYVKDSINVEIPEFADGVYDVVCKSGDLTSKCRYEKFTIALACMANSEGPGIYAADHISGEPVKEAVIEVCDKNENYKIIAESGLIKLDDGFTRIPEDLIQIADNIREGYIAVRSGGRRSGHVRYFKNDSADDDVENKRCRILFDRRAFNTGDLVHFKLICTVGKYDIKPLACSNVTVVMKDASHHVAEERELVTDEWGCADGEMVLRPCTREGFYSFSVMQGEKTIGRNVIKVDDSELPDFELAFDTIPETLYLPIDEIVFGGHAVAFPSHNLSEATVEYTVTKDGTLVKEGNLSLSSEGDFRIKVPVDREIYKFAQYRLYIRITAKGGKTEEFIKDVFVEKAKADTAKPPAYTIEDISDEGHIGARIVSAPQEKTRAVVELYGPGNELLEKQAVCFIGETKVVYPFKPSYPDYLDLHVYYFRNDEFFEGSIPVSRDKREYDLELSFIRFVDVTRPRTSYSFVIKTGPDVQCTASIFNKSADTVLPGTWNQILPYNYRGQRILRRHDPGINGSQTCITMIRGDKKYRSVSSYIDGIDDLIPTNKERGIISERLYGSDPYSWNGHIRKSTANTMVWKPSLFPDAEGNVTLDFTTSDKLSPYCVQVFATDKKMRNAVMMREMKVTAPVRISMVESNLLNAGDSLAVRTVLSNDLGRDVSGILVFDDTLAFPVTVKAGASGMVQNTVMPVKPGSKTLTIVFIPDDKEIPGDGMKLAFPAMKASQGGT